MRKLKLCFIGGGAIVVLLAAVFHGSLLRGLGGLVVYENADFDHVDAVVVPAGVVPGRAFQAANLLRESRAGMAILCREEVRPRFKWLKELGVHLLEDHEINQDVLLKLGVEETRIELLPDVARSTWEEAQALKRYLAEHPLDSIVISTCQYHSYRAYLNFEKALEGTGVKIYSIPSRYCEFDPQAWWKDRDQIKILYVELASLAAFFLGKR
ncbi:YdcF family protein [Acidobacteria bacterium AH-259-A15]|nr:YdcF family protein [Acidobacteria bacterium AH-259-A15]